MSLKDCSLKYFIVLCKYTYNYNRNHGKMQYAPFCVNKKYTLLSCSNRDLHMFVKKEVRLQKKRTTAPKCSSPHTLPPFAFFALLFALRPLQVVRILLRLYTVIHTF